MKTQSTKNKISKRDTIKRASAVKRKPAEDHTVKLHHPICHMLVGERLYYLLVKSTLAIADIEAKIQEALSDKNLRDQACAYFLFGDFDAIIRVWASDRDVNKLKEQLFDNRINVDRCLLISNIYTWYQRIIENQAEAKGTSVENELQAMHENNILCGEYSSVLSISHNVQTRINRAARFFMFLESDYRSPIASFDRLHNTLHSKEHSSLTGKLMLSLYSYYTPNKRGLLIKGQAPDITSGHNSISELQDIVREVGVGSVTYLTAKNIIPESDALCVKTRVKAEFTRKKCVKNLLKLHDCYEEKYEHIGDAKAQVEAYITIVANQYKHLCDYNAEWKSNLNNLRKLYRWIAFKKESDIKSFLMWNYAQIEWLVCDNVLHKYARNVIASHVKGRKLAIIKQAQNVLKLPQPDTLRIADFIMTSTSVQYNPSQLSLGLAHTLIRKIAKDIDDSVDRNILNDIADILEKCARVRNKMMHGKANKLFELDQNDAGEEEYKWENYVNSYLVFTLRWPNAKVILLKYL